MKLIDKEAVVAEIKNLIERAEAERVLHPKTILAARNYILIEDYKKLLSFIDSMQEEPQVKESTKIQYVNETCKENGYSLTQEPVSEDLESFVRVYREEYDYAKVNFIKEE